MTGSAPPTLDRIFPQPHASTWQRQGGGQRRVRRPCVENTAPCERASSGLILAEMKIKAVVHPEESGGFWAEVPSLPGCFTQGETIEELEENLQEAVEAWLLAACSVDIGQEG